jgi:hypothetical protein
MTRTRLGRNPRALEIAEILQATLGAADERPVVGVALRDIELASDHVVACAGIAADVDPLDIGALALVDRKDEIDHPRLSVAHRARAHRREREAPLRGLDGHVLDRLLDRLGVVDVARECPQPRPQQ